jgi:monovalent cation:H+ antiporter, CPA1 family
VRESRGAPTFAPGGARARDEALAALSLPQTPWRGEILFVCYMVVVFTIVVQGLTIERVIGLLCPRERQPVE